MPGSTIANQLTLTTPVFNYLTDPIVPNRVSLTNATSYNGSGRVTVPNAGGGGTGAGSVGIGWGFHDGNGGAAGVVTAKNVYPTYDELIGTWSRIIGTTTGTYTFFEPNTTFEITNHGLVTGSILYYSYSGATTVPVYVIPLTNNTFRLATSLVNAQSGTAATFGIGALTSAPAVQYLNVNTDSLYQKFAIELYPASAKSSIAFSINTPVQIDWNTAGNTQSGQNAGIVAGLWINSTNYYLATTNTNSSFLYSRAILNNGSGISFGASSADNSYKGRIIIKANRAIEFWMARNITNPTYTLCYTQSALAANSPPLYFVAGFCLKNQRLENCTITYL